MTVNQYQELCGSLSASYGNDSTCDHLASPVQQQHKTLYCPQKLTAPLNSIYTVSTNTKQTFTITCFHSYRTTVTMSVTKIITSKSTK